MNPFGRADRPEMDESIDLAMDFNHDGIIDRRDVDAIARQAVALGAGSMAAKGVQG